MTLKQPLQQAADALLDFDEQAHELFKPAASSRIAEALEPISKLGDQPQLRTLCAGMIIVGMLTRNRRLTNAGSRMIIAHETATFAKEILKTEIDRTRPRSATSRDDKKPRKGNHESKELSSFPSGHSAGAIATARAFAREYPEAGVSAIAAAAGIAAVQIVRCAHYPTDVAAGLAIGMVAEFGTDVLWRGLGIDERGS